jgi:predicted nucleic acid-binding protein
MRRSVFDTNILIRHFQELRPFDRSTPAHAHECASRLISRYEADAIVAPVEVEFLCGVLSEHERRLREAFLATFRIIDQRRVLPEDWQEAKRLAKHPGYVPRPRDLGDCLILAIADRLRHEVITDDRGLRRQHGRTRQRRP